MKTNIHLWSYLAQFFLEWNFFFMQVLQRKSKHTFYVQLFLGRGNSAVCEIMWTNIIESDRPQTTTWSMRIACWIPKATNTYWKYVILIDFPQQQWLHECFAVLRYTYIACLFTFSGWETVCYTWERFEKVNTLNARFQTRKLNTDINSEYYIVRISERLADQLAWKGIMLMTEDKTSCN